MFLKSWAVIALCSLVVGCGDEEALDPTSGGIDMDTTNDGSLSETVLDGGIIGSSVTIETLVDETSLTLQFGVGTFEFQVDESVRSLAVIVYGQANGWYGIDAWSNGDGTPLVTADWPSLLGNERGCFSCANFANQAQGASTTIAPNLPTAVIAPGRHQISVVGWEDGFGAETVSVRVLAKVGNALPSSGVIDLNFYFTDAQGWNSDSVQADPYFAASIARVNEVYGRVGIEIGALTFQDIDPSFSVISIAEGQSELGALVAQSTLDQTAGVNIFFVDEILTGEAEFPSIPGVSASVPNPPYLQGTVASGVAISLNGPLSVEPENRFLDPPAIGQTLCHELGHAFGLFHTSEYDLVSHDAFEDTAENDTAFLMHADGTGMLISPHQRNALFANPLIRHPAP
jgi:hypothetical protein